MELIRGGDTSREKRVRNTAATWEENGKFYARLFDHWEVGIASGDTKLECLQNLTKMANEFAEQHKEEVYAYLENEPSGEDIVRGLSYLPKQAATEVWDALEKLQAGIIGENETVTTIREIIKRHQAEVPAAWGNFLD